MCYNSYSFLLCRKGGFSPLICIKFFMSKIFFNFSMICLDAIHFVLILLGVLSRLVFVINFGKLSAFITTSILFLLLLIFQLYICYSFWNCPMILGCSICFFTFFLFFSLYWLTFSFLISSCVASSLPISPLKTFFIPIAVYLIPHVFF